jgi:AAA domain
VSPVILRTTGFSDYLDEKAHIKALILGPPGAGKTRSSSFWPRPILLNCETGEMAVADRKLPVFDIHTEQDMNDALRHVKLESMKKDRRWDTAIVDTLDSYQRRVIQDYLKRNGKGSMSGWQDWGYLDAVMTRLMDELQNLSMNVVVNLHVKETMEGDEEDGTKQRVYSPKLKGDLKDQIAADFDFVGFMSVDYAAENGKRVLRRSIKWLPEPRYPFLKDRSGRLPETTVVDFTDEDYGRLLNALIGGYDNLTEGETLEIVGDPDPVTPAPVAAKVGGPIADASTVAPPRKTAAAKPPELPAAEPAGALEIMGAGPEPALAVVPPAAPASVPVAPRPAPAGIPVAAKPAAATVVPPQSEPEEAPTEVRTPVRVADEPEMTQEEAVANVQEGLGGEVLSDDAPVDAPAHEEQPAAPAPAPSAATSKAYVDYNCGEQPPGLVGHHPAAPGCGALLSTTGTTNDKLQITALKARTLLCPPCFITFKENAA